MDKRDPLKLLTSHNVWETIRGIENKWEKEKNERMMTLIIQVIVGRRSQFSLT